MITQPNSVHNTKVHNIVTFKATWENRNVQEMWKGRKRNIHQGNKMSGWWGVKQVGQIKSKAESEIDF